MQTHHKKVGKGETHAPAAEVIHYLRNGENFSHGPYGRARPRPRAYPKVNGRRCWPEMREARPLNSRAQGAH